LDGVETEEGSKLLARPVAFEGVEYPNRIALARHLAPRVGRSVGAVRLMLSRKKENGGAVVRHYAQMKPCPLRTMKPIAYDGVTYPSRAALARHLAPQVRRSAEAVEGMLIKLGDDVEAVVQRYAQMPPSKLIVFEDVTYRSRFALARHLALRLGRCVSSMDGWLSVLGNDGEAVVCRCQEPLRRRRRPTLVAAE
jgi:hypothetical protein